METILVVDDDPSVLRLLRANLAETYNVITTEDPEQVLGLALKHKPAAILLDLMMPRYSGFELCQCLHSLSYTSRIPLFVVTGESAEKYQTHCHNLGASAFIEKPVDFEQLKEKLAREIHGERPERRAQVRVSLRVVVSLKGRNAREEQIHSLAMTDNLSAASFLCSCLEPLSIGGAVEVFLGVENRLFAGRAKVVRCESPRTPWQKYAFWFMEKSREWVFDSAS